MTEDLSQENKHGGYLEYDSEDNYGIEDDDED